MILKQTMSYKSTRKISSMIVRSIIPKIRRYRCINRCARLILSNHPNPWQLKGCKEVCWNLNESCQLRLLFLYHYSHSSPLKPRQLRAIVIAALRNSTRRTILFNFHHDALFIIHFQRSSNFPCGKSCGSHCITIRPNFDTFWHRARVCPGRGERREVGGGETRSYPIRLNTKITRAWFRAASAVTTSARTLLPRPRGQYNRLFSFDMQMKPRNIQIVAISRRWLCRLLFHRRRVVALTRR